MMRFRLVLRRTVLARWLFGALLLASVGFAPERLSAQKTAAAPSVESSAAAPGTDLPASTSDEGASDLFGNSECNPPSTQEWVFIALGTLVVFVVSFLLLVRLIQRHYIRQDKNATLGRHLGISLTFFVSSAGMVGVAYLVTGCLHPQFWVWLCFPLALWLIHLIYTLAVVRNE